jgi:thioredoxin-related protein
MHYISTMKKIILFLSLIIAVGCTQAQTTQSPAKPNIDNIPSFKILSQDSVYLTNANLKKNKGVVIIYFSPDCSHCQHMMYELKPDMKKFSNVNVVMVTFIQTSMLKMLRDFRKDYKLDDYPNFITGTEFPNYILQRYYQVATTPYIAVYDKKGKLVKAYSKAPKADELLAQVKKI